MADPLPRKRRRIAVEEEEDENTAAVMEEEADVDTSFLAPQDALGSALTTGEDDEEEEEEEEEVVELSSGWTAPRPAAAAGAASAAKTPTVGAAGLSDARRPVDNGDDEDDEVTILADSRSSPATAAVKAERAAPAAAAPVKPKATPAAAQPPPKRARRAYHRAPSPRSPEAPRAEALSPPRSPDAPPGSPVAAATAAADDGFMDSDAYADDVNASADHREKLAVWRAREREQRRQADRKPPMAMQDSATAASASGLPPQPSPATPAAAATPQPLRRRKAGAAAAPSSSLASASLLDSYSTSMGMRAPMSRVAPELLWHHDNAVLCPTNASDRVDVERTFLQQVLVWDPFNITQTPSAVAAAASGSGGIKRSPDVPRDMQAFSKFLDPSVPLPVHFTTPQAYLGYFAPIVLDNFRAQMSQSVALNLGELRKPQQTKPQSQPKPEQVKVEGAAAAPGGKAASASAAPASAAAQSTNGNLYAPLVPVLSGQAPRYRSCWSATSMTICPVTAGGGDDWFDLRLRLSQPHQSLNELMGADILVLGVDEVPKSANATPSQAFAPIPPPSPSTLYAFAFLDGIHLDQLGTTARVRLYLPGVGSSMSTYVAPSSVASSARSRFQLLFNRLSQAVGAASNPEVEGGEVSVKGLFGGGGAASARSAGRTSPAAAAANSNADYHVYVTRIDTIITTLREYTALVKIGCLLGLRLQDELLRPSADADSDDEDDVNASAARAIKAEPSLLSNGDDTHAGPPALESVDDVARSTASAAPSVKKLPPIAPHLSRHLSHLDSSAWMGLPANYREFLSGTLNEHQLKAVQVALQRYDKPGFTLLQGPPGTGKTKTIVALLNALHLGDYQRFYDQLITQLTSPNAAHAATLKPRILVCAPSNTAVDELITRVMDPGSSSQANKPAAKPGDKTAATASSAGKPAESSSSSSAPSTPADALHARLKGIGGFIDGSFQRYKPAIVRVGHSDSMRPELRAVISLEALVENYHGLTEEQLKERHRNARGFMAQQEQLLNNLRTRHGRSAYVERESKQLLDKLASLGHDVTKQPQYLDWQRGRNDHLALQRQIAHEFESHHLAQLDAHRCELSLAFKQAGRAASLGGPGAGNTRREKEAALDTLRISFLNQAEIVFCTLSGSGLDLLSRLDQPFRALIIDEAAQCTEVAALIPLTHDVQHCVLVGDPRQLPATVFSQDAAAKRMWERSLFERLEQAGHQMHALVTQYRMHSDIRQFPSDYFYSGLLQDAEFIRSGPLYKQPYHLNTDFRPLLYLDFQSTSHRGDKLLAAADEDPSLARSMGNSQEAALIVNMLCALMIQFPQVNPKQIGIITFYAKQKSLLHEQLKSRAMAVLQMAGGKPVVATGPGKGGSKQDAAAQAIAASGNPLAQGLTSIEVSTVDGFQGREKEIIVVSCVRGGAAGGLGFVDDVRRMNVALTRAKFACWVVGDSRALRKSSHWRAFLDSATQRGMYRFVQPTDFQAYDPRHRLLQQRQQHTQQQQQHQMQQQFVSAQGPAPGSQFAFPQQQQMTPVQPLLPYPVDPRNPQYQQQQQQQYGGGQFQQHPQQQGLQQAPPPGFALLPLPPQMAAPATGAPAGGAPVAAAAAPPQRKPRASLII